MAAKPGMIITGAVGLLGSHLVGAFQPEYEIFAIDRRPPGAGNAPEGPNIHWLQVDICNFDVLRQVFDVIQRKKNCEILLHLAGYYDFTGEDHPEYQRSNVEGMRNVLELATQLPLKRLIFTSSAAACPFPKPGQTITEDTPPTAPPPYSRSKRAGEEMLREYRNRIPSTIVRLAAIFSDWCDYEPLTHFLHTWFSGGWNARIMGGRGEWAIPYMHIQDLIAFFRKVIEISPGMESAVVLQGSPNGSTTTLDLYREATRSYYGSPRFAIHVPKPLAWMGIIMRERMGRITGQMPFERPWMGEYIDLRLDVDASRTHRLLDWTPTPELDILKRMPVIVHNLRYNPEEWELRSRRRQMRQLA